MLAFTVTEPSGDGRVGVFLVMAPILFLAIVAALRAEDWTAHRASLRGVREHLAILTRNGLPLGPGLLALAKERDPGRSWWWRRREGRWIRELAQRLDAAGSLAGALENERGLYSLAGIALIRAAEAKGALPQALEILATEDDDWRGWTARIRGVLTYPLAAFMLVFGIMAFLEVFIIPKYKAIFESMNIELPAVTQSLLGASEFMEEDWWVVVLAVAAVAVLGFQLSRRRWWPQVRGWIFSLAGRVPVLGPPLRKIAHARWLGRTGAFLDAGATLPEALEVASEASFGASRRELARAAELARAGEPIEKVLAEACGRDARELVPAILLAAGDGLPAACRATAARIRDRAERRLRAVLAAGEPIAIVPVGALVALHLVAVFLPIVKLEGSLIP